MSKKDATSNAVISNNPVATKKRRENENVEFVGSVIVNPQISFSNIRIAIPKLRNNINYKLPDNDSLILQVKNGNGLESQPTRISLIKEVGKGDNKQIFADFIPHKIHIVCGSSKYFALSTSTGHVITYTEFGRRILPPIVLGSPLSFLEIKDAYLLAVTSTGELFVWNLDEKKSLFKPVSLYPLLQPLYLSGQASSVNSMNNTNPTEANDNNTGKFNVNLDQCDLVSVNGALLTRSENLTICSITSQGIPIVTLSNGNGYLFNKMMNTWSLISDSWWAFGSQYWDSSLTIDHMKDVSLLEFMESHTNEEITRRGKAKFFTKISKMMLMREGYENLETIISLNHLENKINFYMFLNDYDNYKTFLIIYAKRLSELNLKNRLLEILNGLFVDMNGEICGHPKNKLLVELILSCSRHREVQHILVQYSESIGLLNLEDDSDLDIL
jgi:protein HIRA/HIR1